MATLGWYQNGEYSSPSEPPATVWAGGLSIDYPKVTLIGAAVGASGAVAWAHEWTPAPGLWNVEPPEVETAGALVTVSCDFFSSAFSPLGTNGTLILRASDDEGDFGDRLRVAFWGWGATWHPQSGMHMGSYGGVMWDVVSGGALPPPDFWTQFTHTLESP
ncbi:MAG: hypothetical protein ACTTJV_08740 [Ottowia sp.]